MLSNPLLRTDAPCRYLVWISHLHIVPSGLSKVHTQFQPVDGAPLTIPYSLSFHTSPEGSLQLISIEIWPHVSCPATTHSFPA